MDDSLLLLPRTAMSIWENCSCTNAQENVWLREQHVGLSPNDQVAKAIACSLNAWDAPIRFLDGCRCGALALGRTGRPATPQVNWISSVLR